MKFSWAVCRKSVDRILSTITFVVECIKDVVVFGEDRSRMISLNVGFTHATKQIQPDESPELEFKGENCWTCEVFDTIWARGSWQCFSQE